MRPHDPFPIGGPHASATTPSSTTDADPVDAFLTRCPVRFDHGDGSHSTGRIDLYKRGCFVLETKQGVAAGHTLACARDSSTTAACCVSQRYQRKRWFVARSSRSTASDVRSISPAGTGQQH
jgi:hypothetical protein